MSEVTVLQKIGLAIDRRYLKKAGATTIPGSTLGVIMICYHPYHGQTPLTFQDGVTIQPGELIVEMHFSNQRIAELGKEKSDRSMEWRLMEILKGEFAALAKAAADGIIPESVKGFYGVNVLIAGAKRLGFTLVPLPKGFNRWWLGFWETVLRMIFYSFKTKKKASFQKTKDPFEVWITRQELIKRYLNLKQP